MKRCKAVALAAALSWLAACADSGDDPPQQFTATLIDVAAVKQGSNEPVPIDGVPVEGATLTLR